MADIKKTGAVVDLADDAIKTLNAAKVDSQGNVDPEAMKKFQATPAVSTVKVKGFECQMAKDLFVSTGDKPAAQRADALIKIFGDLLYQQIKIGANNAGLNNEADWLSQEIWLMLEKEEFDIEGATEPFVEAVDGKAESEQNVLIGTWLRKSNLGRIMQIAKAAKVSILDAVRWAVLNRVVTNKEIGYGV